MVRRRARHAAPPEEGEEEQGEQEHPSRSELVGRAAPPREGREEGVGPSPAHQDPRKRSAPEQAEPSLGPSDSWCELPSRAVKDGITVDNRSGYRTTDIRRLVDAGLQAYATPEQRKRLLVVVKDAPKRTRGCARLGGDVMVWALARPSKFSRKGYLILRHEIAHLAGADHHEMSDDILWSKGPIPAWARGLPLRRERA